MKCSRRAGLRGNFGGSAVEHRVFNVGCEPLAKDAALWEVVGFRWDEKKRENPRSDTESKSRAQEKEETLL